MPRRNQTKMLNLLGSVETHFNKKKFTDQATA